MEDCTIEFVVFWLDAEHFRHFDGRDDDIKLFAHHISEWEGGEGGEGREGRQGGEGGRGVKGGRGGVEGRGEERGREGIQLAREPLFPSLVLKYIGYYAELPINLPKDLEDRIVAEMQGANVGQGE